MLNEHIFEVGEYVKVLSSLRNTLFVNLCEGKSVQYQSKFVGTICRVVEFDGFVYKVHHPEFSDLVGLEECFPHHLEKIPQPINTQKDLCATIKSFLKRSWK